MKIVIDIPEEIYNHTQEYEVGGFNQENDTKLFMAIKDGIPLPKHHGRLIDADALSARMEQRVNEVGDDRAIWEASGVETALDMYAPTIIEGVTQNDK